MSKLTVFVTPDSIITFSVKVTDGAGKSTTLTYYPDFKYYPPPSLANPDQNHLGDQYAEVNNFTSAASFAAVLSITTAGGGAAIAHFDVDDAERKTSLTATWKNTTVEGAIS